MKNLITGTWSLERFDIEEPSKNIRPWGKNTKGLLIYTSDGHMSVSINRDVENKSGQDAKDIFDSILFYSGTYVADSDVIRHKVTNASNPSRIGKEMIRYAALDGDRLTLKSPVESFGQATVVWRKIK
ncbi:MAG: hypothetical protein EXR74_09590 [Bdellovibrionales bacterium]|nr:hypothetical protein [Bdellovibrionales bacterium]